MDPSFVLILWKASEIVLGKVVEKGFDAAGKPVEEGLSDKFKKLAGQDEATQRRAAFVAAAATARERTIEQATEKDQPGRILTVLDDRLSQGFAEQLATESAKVLLLADAPDVA